MNRLVVISNRVGPLSDEGKAGGLAVGLADALRQRGGLWFGWSGKTSEEGTFGPLQIKTEGEVQLVTIDMTTADLADFYNGFANQALWPVLHYRMDLAGYDRRFAEGFWRINERMGARLAPLMKPDDLVWVHDYHFIPLGGQNPRVRLQRRDRVFSPRPLPAAGSADSAARRAPARPFDARL